MNAVCYRSASRFAMKFQLNDNVSIRRWISSAILSALACTLVAPSRLGSQQRVNFTIAAIGGFGEPLTGCRVESFRLVDPASSTRQDYKDHFRGLTARDLPVGEYDVDIGCREARIGTQMNISAGVGFGVASENRRITRSDPPPHLVIRINEHWPSGETWWITMRALYQHRSYTVEFQSETGEAHINDPDPGSFVVNVLSSTGYNCLREIDLVERTRLWTFDPSACAFHVDAYAHVVTDEDKRARKTTSWYQQLRKNEDEFWHALEKAAKDSNSQK
jgi:hypothetical protein